jgi:hypothetical protein
MLPVRPETPAMSATPSSPSDLTSLNHVAVTPSANGQETPPANRDSNGRFTKGNAGGPGNPYNRRVAELRRALMSVVSDEDICAIGRVLLEKAKSGDLAAIKLLFTYLLGKPAAAPDPDAVDLHEWQLRRQSPPVQEVADVIHDAMSAQKACDLVGETLPLMDQSAAVNTAGRMARQPLLAPLAPPSRAVVQSVPDSKRFNRPKPDYDHRQWDGPPLPEEDEDGLVDGIMSERVAAEVIAMLEAAWQPESEPAKEGTAKKSGKKRRRKDF